MNYQQLSPPDYLKDYVRHFWVLESPAADVPSKSFRTIADGCPGLIFQPAEKGILFQNEKELPPVFLYGQATRPATLSLNGTFCTIGVVFFPHALKAVFGINAGEITDSCLNVDLLSEQPGSALSEQLANIPSIEDQLQQLSAFLLLLIRRHERHTDEAMRYALSSILQSKGRISLPDLRDQLQLTERSFERRFKQHVGIPPKLFSRITRFQASLQELRHNRYSKLSDIAFENEYADQSHFIRTFREFAGLSPFQYQKQSAEVMENLSELPR